MYLLSEFPVAHLIKSLHTVTTRALILMESRQEHFHHHKYASFLRGFH